MIDAQSRSKRANDEAAAWFARLNTNKVSNGDLRAFFEWRRDPANSDAYADMERVRGLLHGLRDDPEMRAFADAALARRGLGQWLKINVGNAISSPTTWLIVSACAIALVAAAMGFSTLSADQYVTGVGDRRIVRLEDGSTMTLNTDSRAHVRLDDHRRVVRLDRGQAFFEVAHDVSRPFLVEADGAQVRAVGTRFDVDRTDKQVRVTLTQGKVEVEGAHSRRWTLYPGQELTVRDGDAKADVPTPVHVDTGAATSWTQGRVTLKDEPLVKAVAEINRYSRRKVVLNKSAPGGLRINGVFDAGDTNAFVSAVTVMLDLRASHRPNGDVELLANTPSDGSQKLVFGPR